MLQNYFISELTQLELIQDTVFEQDVMPCHFTQRVGKSGSISWPPQTLDLNPLDIFLGELTVLKSLLNLILINLWLLSKDN